jgi:glycosyltransferase involved in cell wall biosynthesis
MEKIMPDSLPLVSIVIPCRNEERFIKSCLDSVIDQDYPKDRIEIIIIDGMSEDGTRPIVEQYSQKQAFVKLLVNPDRITPCALNIGIKEAKGEVIIRMDAHAKYKNDYISKCVKYLYEYKADNVGGTMVTLPQQNTISCLAIVSVLTSRFGVGNSDFRTGTRQPKATDTVFGGCYRKDVFDKIGYFNEKLVRNQDLEFNLRLKKSGGKIILVPEIVSYYYPKPSLGEFFKHNFKDSFWVIYPLKFGIKTFSWRHLAALFFILGLLITGIAGVFFPVFLWLFLAVSGSYLLASICFSANIACQNKDIRYLFIMPVAFANRHISYGLGSVWGAIKIII